MGVPTLTLVGKTVVGRAGWSQLCNLGLKELAAKTPERFVQIAVDLAGDLPRLQALRSGLRERMRGSPLMDATRFTRGIEQAYRVMWQKWCAQQHREHESIGQLSEDCTTTEKVRMSSRSKVDMTQIPISMVADARGKPVQFITEPGVEHFVRRALSGQDYPAVFPDVFHPHTIVDIGAHVGSATLYFRHVYPQARIFCFEPNPVCFELLTRNIKGDMNIHASNVALGPTNAQQQLFAGVYSSMQASLIPNEENRKTGPMVAVRAVSEILTELKIESISLLKVDTEGLELPILRALGNNLLTVDVIYLEYHSERDRRDLDQLLAERFVLFASQATKPDRGTVCYVRADSLNHWRALSSMPRSVFPKQPARE
jgi:FkbM family methyltransferase